MIAKTSHDFIHEYGIIDDFAEALHEANTIINESVFQYKQAVHSIEMKQLFEAASDDYPVMLEKEGQGVLAKIGNAVVTLIKKIGEFIEKFASAFLGFFKKDKDEAAKVTKMVKENPALSDRILKGLKKEWFTTKDVAQYEKDINGLIKMLEKHEIDHKTFKDRMADAFDKFNKSAVPLCTTVGTISAVLAIGPNLAKAADSNKKLMEKLKTNMEVFEQEKLNNQTNPNMDDLQAVLGAFNKAYMGFNTNCGTLLKIKNTYERFKKGILEKSDLYNKAVKKSTDAANTRAHVKDSAAFRKMNADADIIKQFKELQGKMTADGKFLSVSDGMKYQRLLREHPDILPPKEDKK